MPALLLANIWLINHRKREHTDVWVSYLIWKWGIHILGSGRRGIPLAKEALMKKDLFKRIFPFATFGCAALLCSCASSDPDRTEHYSTSYAPAPGSSQTASSAAVAVDDNDAMGASQVESGEIRSDQVVIPLHEERVTVGKRIVDAGSVRLRKQVTTETINQPVEIRRETLVIDRQNSDGTTTSTEYQATGQNFSGSSSESISQPFNQGEMVIRLQREEPVVEKQVVPAGKIVVQTRTDTQQQNVQREVRRETIDVEKIGNPENVIVSENLQGQVRSSAGAPASEPQRLQGSAPQPQTVPVPSDPSDTEYRAPVTTRENERFPRPQPDGRETFPELQKDPERR